MFKDIWLENIKLEIGKRPPKLFDCLSKISRNDDESGAFAVNMKPKILDCVRLVKTFLGEIRGSAPNYTLHDLTHSINVIDLMGQLVNCEKLSAVEVSLLIYSALLHDVGMVKLEGEDISLDEIRENHGNRSARFIEEEVLVNAQNEPLSFGEYKDFFMLYLPLICASHMQDFISVEKLPYDYRINGIKADISLCAILLRLADAMDLSRNRAPYALFNILHLKGVSAEHWQKHLSITNYQIDENGYFRVDGICHDEKIHRCLFNHFDLIEEELNKVFRWYIGNNIPSPLTIKNNIVLRHIDSKGYQLWSHSIQMDFPAISKLFMGEHLYGDKKVGLRELVQNSIDACLVRKELATDDYSYVPKIDIHFDFDNNYFYLKDNGTGMTEDIIRKYFLNIGVSYYGSPDYTKLKLKYEPTGFFGIGFLSCFMLSDEVQVRTCSWQDPVEHILHLHKEDRFVSMYTNKNSAFTGTEIRLNLTSVCRAFQADEFEILKKVKHYISPLFWRLQFVERGTTLTSKINRGSFQKYANEQFTGYRKSEKIQVSKYLDGIDGFMLIFGLSDVRSMWKLSGVSYNELLDALQNGAIVLGNEIEKAFPFCENAYIFNGRNIKKIKFVDDISKSCKFEWAVLLLTATSEPIFPASHEPNQFVSIFSTVSLSKHLRKTSDTSSFGFGLYTIKNGTFLTALQKEFNCDCTSVALNPLKGDISQLLYTPRAYQPKTNFIFLKQTRINFEVRLRNLCRYGFECNKFLLNITNSKIVPNTSRNELLAKDKQYLVTALEICLDLWLLDNLVDYPKAKKSCEFIAKCILGIWDDNNPFLVSAKEKYISSGHLDFIMSSFD